MTPSTERRNFWVLTTLVALGVPVMAVIVEPTRHNYFSSALTGLAFGLLIGPIVGVLLQHRDLTRMLLAVVAAPIAVSFSSWLVPYPDAGYLWVLFGQILIAVAIRLSRPERRMPWDRMPEHASHECWSCGYDLRGLPINATICPECGESMTPELSKGLKATSRTPPQPSA